MHANVLSALFLTVWLCGADCVAFIRACANHPVGQPLHSLPPASNKFALVVGVDRYANAVWPELRYARTNDAAVAAALRTLGFSVEALTGDAATHASMVSSHYYLTHNIRLPGQDPQSKG